MHTAHGHHMCWLCMNGSKADVTVRSCVVLQGGLNAGTSKDELEGENYVQWFRKLMAQKSNTAATDIVVYNLKDYFEDRRRREAIYLELVKNGEDTGQRPMGQQINIDDSINHETHQRNHVLHNEVDDPGSHALPGTRGREPRQLLQRAHEGLGHPQIDRFIRILKGAKASKEVLTEAQKSQCSVCEKFKLTRPPPPREFGINEVVVLDTVWLTHLGQQKKVALNIIDYSSHFQMMIPLKGQSPDAAWEA